MSESLSAAQSRALRSLRNAEEMHSSAEFREQPDHPGWFIHFPWRVMTKTLQALERRGLVESHPELRLWRITRAGINKLTERGYVTHIPRLEQQP